MKRLLLFLLFPICLIAQNKDYPEYVPKNTQYDDSLYFYVEVSDDSSRSITLYNIRTQLDENNFTSAFNARVDSTLNTQSLYGANIRNFVAKCNWNNRHPNIDTVKVLFIGDSIISQTAAWGSFALDSTYLRTTWSNVTFVITNKSYGGYDWSHFSGYYENEVIGNNVDLVVFCEHDSWDDNMLEQLERALVNIRSKSTTDIVIQTTNPNNAGTITENVWKELRALANKYNCQLIDPYRLWVNHIATTDDTIDSLTTDGTHPNAAGHQLYYQEFVAHFDSANSKNYHSNATFGLEQKIELESPIILYDSLQVAAYGSWVKFTNNNANFAAAQSTALNDSLVITLPPCTGFEIQWLNNSLVSPGTFDIYVDDDKPSAIRVDGKALEYTSFPTYDSGNSNADVLHRLFKVFVLDTTSIDSFQVKVIDATADSFHLQDWGDAGTDATYGAGTFDANFTSDNSDIYIPTQIGTIDNWLGYADYQTGDIFYFYVKRNWRDTMTTQGTTYSMGKVYIGGLENKTHTVKLVHTNTNTLLLDYITAFCPPLHITDHAAASSGSVGTSYDVDSTTVTNGSAFVSVTESPAQTFTVDVNSALKTIDDGAATDDIAVSNGAAGLQFPANTRYLNTGTTEYFGLRNSAGTQYTMFEMRTSGSFYTNLLLYSNVAGGSSKLTMKSDACELSFIAQNVATGGTYGYFGFNSATNGTPWYWKTLHANGTNNITYHPRGILFINEWLAGENTSTNTGAYGSLRIEPSELSGVALGDTLVSGTNTSENVTWWITNVGKMTMPVVHVPDSLHVGDNVTFLYAVPGGADWVTSSDSTDKNISKRKKPGKDKSLRDATFEKILKVEESEYRWKPEAVRQTFDCTEFAEWDSLTVLQQDSLRLAWNIAEERRVDEVCSKLRFGPMAQDIAAGIGGDGESIEWDRVNSEFRFAVQELIVENSEQAARIETLENQLTDVLKRLDKLEKGKNATK